MKKDLVFLAVDGKLTSSSAGHLRNLAASKANEILTRLNMLHFTNKYINLIGSSARNQSQIGITEDALRSIPAALAKVVQYQAFEAWMNEAIVARDNLYKELRGLDLDDWYAQSGETKPERPEMAVVMTEDDYLSKLTIKERNRFYMLQTEVAAIGKLIHKGGPFDLAMKEMQECAVNPITEILNGRDTILHETRPSLSADAVNEVYFALQSQHRSMQAQLNGMKDQMEKAIKKDSLDKTNAYQEELQKYNATIKEAQTKLSAYKQEMLAELEKLKIVIPEHLMDTYKELSALGK